MKNIHAGSIILYLFFLITGIIIAFLIWLIVIMPLQIVRPIEFTPVHIDNKTLQVAESKIQKFLSEDKILELTSEEACSILKKSLEENLGLNITGIYLELPHNSTIHNEFYKVSGIFKVEIKDIPRTNLLTLVLRLRNVEHTTTLISASLKTSNGGIDYLIDDFRLGGFKIPDFIIRKFFRKGHRNLDGINLIDIEFRKNTIVLKRE